jgi:hypothetical protein
MSHPEALVITVVICRVMVITSPEEISGRSRLIPPPPFVE